MTPTERERRLLEALEEARFHNRVLTVIAAVLLFALMLVLALR